MLSKTSVDIPISSANIFIDGNGNLFLLHQNLIRLIKNAYYSGLAASSFGAEVKLSSREMPKWHKNRNNHVNFSLNNPYKH